MFSFIGIEVQFRHCEGGGAKNIQTLFKLTYMLLIYIKAPPPPNNYHSGVATPFGTWDGKLLAGPYIIPKNLVSKQKL